MNEPQEAVYEIVPAAGIGDNSARAERLEEINRRIVVLTDEIMHLGDDIANKAEEFGALCLEAEPLVPKGQWHKWLEDNVCERACVKLRTVQKWIQWAREINTDNDESSDKTLDHSTEIMERVFGEGSFGYVPETPPVGSVAVPPQAKRAVPKVEVKTPPAVKALPRGTPKPPTPTLEEHDLGKPAAGFVRIDCGYFYVDKAVDKVLGDLVTEIKALIRADVPIETILRTVKDAIGGRC